MIYTRDELYSLGPGHYVGISDGERLLWTDDVESPVVAAQRRINVRKMGGWPHDPRAKPPRQQDLEYIKAWLENNMKGLS